jgi:hypothetical protein
MGLFLRLEQNDGIIVSIIKNRVEIFSNKTCAPSAGCHVGCGACGGNKNKDKTVLTIKNSDQFTTGQKITYKKYILNENLNALFIFGTPILLAVSTILIWFINSPDEVESPMALSATGLAFVCGFAVIWFFDKLFQKKYPSVILTEPVTKIQKVN